MMAMHNSRTRQSRAFNRSCGTRVSLTQPRYEPSHSTIAVFRLSDTTSQPDCLAFAAFLSRHPPLHSQSRSFLKLGSPFNTRLQLNHQDPNVLHAV